MIVNADKFLVLLNDKRKQDHTNEVVSPNRRTNHESSPFS